MRPILNPDVFSTSFFEPTEFSCPVACRNSDNLSEVIEYTADQGDAIAEGYIFWGPYVKLAAGVYLFMLHGQIEGQVTIDLACDQGTHRLKSLTVTDFSDPICLVLMEAITDLEIRALKSAGLRALTLKGVSMTCAYTAPVPTKGKMAAIRNCIWDE